jgi:hypothetical protein
MSFPFNRPMYSSDVPTTQSMPHKLTIQDTSTACTNSNFCREFAQCLAGEKEGTCHLTLIPLAVDPRRLRHSVKRARNPTSCGPSRGHPRRSMFSTSSNTNAVYFHRFPSCLAYRYEDQEKPETFGQGRALSDRRGFKWEWRCSRSYI